MSMRLRRRLRVVITAGLVLPMLAFMVVHVTLTAPMLVAATACDHRLVLLSIHLR